MKKKSLILLLIFILTLFVKLQIFANAGSYYFEWENTTIEIPVFDSLDKYLKLPTAKLYYAGNVVNESVGILYGEDETDPDYIYTNKVGTYKLTYRAVASIEETTTVYFNVVDKVKPQISLNSTLQTALNGSINYEKYISITDNYYALKELDILYDDSKVIYSKAGTYELTVIAKDPSGNQSTEKFDVSIIGIFEDPKYEAVTQDFRIAYGKLFIPSKFFKAYDGTGKNITSKIKAVLDTKTIGNNLVSFEVTDDYGNRIEWVQDIEVYDDIEPIILLKKDRIEINIAEVDILDKDYFLEQITSATDNSEVKSIEVSYSSVRKVIGEYDVVYTVYDIAGNKKEKTLVVSVVCDSVPSIITQDIYISVGDNINYYNYFQATDTYDGDITLNAVVDSSNVNTNSEGVYFAYVSVKNSYGKTTQGTITVHVKKSFIKKYYWVFLIPVGVGVVVSYFIVKKRKSVV